MYNRGTGTKNTSLPPHREISTPSDAVVLAATQNALKRFEAAYAAVPSVTNKLCVELATERLRMMEGAGK